MAFTSGASGRPPANAALRGALLIVLAVVIGIALMSWGFADEGGLIADGDTETNEPTGTTEPSDTAEPADTSEPTATTNPDDALPPPRDQSEITVLVLNGSGVNGAAGRINDRLKPLNYLTRSPDNTPERVAETKIYYLEGTRSEALRLAGELNIADPAAVIEVMPVPAPYGADLGESTSLLVILGEDALISAANP